MSTRPRDKYGRYQKSPEQTETQEFLRLAMDRWKLASEAENEIRAKALDDLKFSIGDQWPDQIKSDRENSGRPCLTMNKLPQFIKQVTNEQRQQRPAAQINPVGDGADVETAEVLQGAIRHIEINSQADIADDTAFDHMVRMGFGFERVLTDYLDDESFDQEIYIRRIKNPFTVYFDPSAEEADYSDAKWCFIIEDIQSDDFKASFKDSQAASLANFSSVGDAPADWLTKEHIRLAEYFYIEESKSKIYKDGKGEETGETPDEKRESREVTKRQVKWAKITAVDILEKKDLPGTFIPVIPALGDDLVVDGKRHLSGLVRHAKDPMRMYNFWVSASTEMIALAPKAPYVGAAGQFTGFETTWAQANVRNMPYLEYNPTNVAGSPVGPPVRQTYEPPIQAINLMVHQADQDLKGTIGIYDASLGQKGPEQSAKAILARQKQGDISTLNYSDNMARLIRHRTKILLQYIPFYYDAPRIQRIVNPDETVKHVGVFNSKSMQGMDEQKAMQTLPQEDVEAAAVKKIYDLGTGRYDVTVSVGPSYQSKRQEAVASQIEVLKVLPPQAQQAVTDLVVRNMDWPGSKEMADRLKKLLPPNMMDDDDQDPEAKVQKLQAQLQALMQQHELLTKTVTDLTDTLQNKKLEMQSKESIEFEKLKTQILLAEINTKAQETQTRLKMEQEMWRELHGAAKDLQMQSNDQAHQAGMASAQNANDQTMQANQQAGDQAMQAGQQGHEAEMAQQQQTQAQ